MNLQGLRANLNIRQTGETRKATALHGKEVTGHIYNRNMRSLRFKPPNRASAGPRASIVQEFFACASPSPQLLHPWGNYYPRFSFWYSGKNRFVSFPPHSPPSLQKLSLVPARLPNPERLVSCYMWLLQWLLGCNNLSTGIIFLTLKAQYAPFPKPLGAFCTQIPFIAPATARGSSGYLCKTKQGD